MFDYKIIEEALKKLSKLESVVVNVKDRGELDTFKNTYPILFSCLDATFELMPSNSRIADQNHRGLRDFLNPANLWHSRILSNHTYQSLDIFNVKPDLD